MPSPRTLERRVLEAACALEAAPDVLRTGNGERGRRARPATRGVRRAKRRVYARLLAAELGVARSVARRTAFKGPVGRWMERRAAARVVARDGVSGAE